METLEKPRKRLYFSSMPFMNYIFSKGTTAVFRHHRFATDKEDEIQQLDYEIKMGHPYISVKADAMYETEEFADPLGALKKKFIAEYLAEQAAHTNPENDFGNYNSGNIKPASTSDIASVAAGGDATQSAAKLVALTQQIAKSVTPPTTPAPTTPAK